LRRQVEDRKRRGPRKEQVSIARFLARHGRDSVSVCIREADLKGLKTLAADQAAAGIRVRTEDRGDGAVDARGLTPYATAGGRADDARKGTSWGFLSPN